jgi:hypothetical protein
MFENMHDHPDFAETQNFLHQGENIIRKFPTDKIASKYEIVSVEEDLYENLFGPYHYKGFVDLILRNRQTGRYKIVDWKTSGQAWDVDKKLADEIFMCQMRFYKFFWGRKHNIDMNLIDCEYIVLNRLENKKKPDGDFGKPQFVPIISTFEEIKYSLITLANAIKTIHIEKKFDKIKHTMKQAEFKHPGCLFCKYKGGKNPLCNSNVDQGRNLLKEHGKI